MVDVLTLIRPMNLVDEYGDPVTEEALEERREVFAEQVSIGQKEFYQAHAVGLKPEIKFKLSDYLDYNDEAIVEHEGQRYRVLRTYRTGQALEITCYKEVNRHGSP